MRWNKMERVKRERKSKWLSTSVREEKNKGKGIYDRRTARRVINNRARLPPNHLLLNLHLHPLARHSRARIISHTHIHIQKYSVHWFSCSLVARLSVYPWPPAATIEYSSIQNSLLLSQYISKKHLTIKIFLQKFKSQSIIYYKQNKNSFHLFKIINFHLFKNSNNFMVKFTVKKYQLELKKGESWNLKIWNIYFSKKKIFKHGNVYFVWNGVVLCVAQSSGSVAWHRLSLTTPPASSTEFRKHANRMNFADIIMIYFIFILDIGFLFYFSHEEMKIIWFFYLCFYLFFHFFFFIWKWCISRRSGL